MRVTIVAETFTPAVNGVVNSVLRVADQLAERGHQPIVVAPSGQSYRSASGHRIEVVRVPSVTLPGYRGLAVARPGQHLVPVLRDLCPDVVHLASPAVLGWAAVHAAADLDVASVAAFQTDLSGFLRRYGLGHCSPLLWSWLRRLHNAADLTLAPSSATAYQLRRHGIGPLAMWSRGVDGHQFHPLRRDERLRESLLAAAGPGGLLVGFVGRLAAEKRVDALEPLTRLPGVQVVIIGDGPRRAALERLMPAARFTGQLSGAQLGATMASLDLLVQPGADETFCQVVQEALCAGVPVISAASGGPLDLVRHGENGWLWAGEDPEVLAALVASAGADRVERAAVRARTRRCVVGRTWTRVTDQLIGHYARVIAARTGRPTADPVVAASQRRSAS
ncbi:MAG: glycosyltransferase family 1 protein [Actinomycetota bacterium]|nr:glycosyltransferase family 1 protein [Actinomycetota bacterium]